MANGQPYILVENATGGSDLQRNLKTVGGNSLLGSGNISISSGITSYTVTTANCENTTTETSVIEFTVPAGTWKDSEIVYMFTPYNLKSSGGSVTFDRKWYINNTVFTSHSAPYSDTTTLYYNLPLLRFMRVDNDLYMFTRTGSPTNANATTETTSNVGIDSTAAMGTYHTYIYKDAGTYDVNFSADVTIKVTVKFDIAAANIYYRNYATKIWKI